MKKLFAACTIMPFVNLSLQMPPAEGYDALRIKPTTEEAPVTGGGAFRVSCPPSHQANDDPLVFPGLPGASHHHTFYGNTSINAYTTDPASEGNSTCNGGIMNRSGYWTPSIIDTRFGRPLVPEANIVYYKKPFGVAPGSVTPPPRGLRMLVGDMHAMQPKGLYQGGYYFECVRSDGRTHSRGVSIPNCPVGERMLFAVIFPHCWNGVALDSPDHVSHMAYVGACPSTHPVVLPAISYNIFYSVRQGDDPRAWRLASDHYDWNQPGGWSAHGDWWNGWDQRFLEQIVRECINADRDCHAHLIGNGEQIY